MEKSVAAMPGLSKRGSRGEQGSEVRYESAELKHGRRKSSAVRHGAEAGPTAGRQRCPIHGRRRHAAAARKDCARRKAVTSCSALARAASALWLAVATMRERMATARSRVLRRGCPAACTAGRKGHQMAQRTGRQPCGQDKLHRQAEQARGVWAQAGGSGGGASRRRLACRRASRSASRAAHSASRSSSPYSSPWT